MEKSLFQENYLNMKENRFIAYAVKLLFAR